MTMTDALRKVLKRLHCPLDVMLARVRWYVAYPLRLRHVEEMMAERGVEVDQPTVYRWAMRILPILTAAFRRHKRPVDSSWRMDETTSWSMANGRTCTGRSTKPETRSISCCAPCVTRWWHSDFSSAPSPCKAFLRK